MESETHRNRHYVDDNQLSFEIINDDITYTFCYDCISIGPEMPVSDDNQIDTYLDFTSNVLHASQYVLKCS